MISIVTPAYNCACTLPATIHSVQAQTFTDWELIIVDDASSDNTLDIIRKEAESDSRIRLLENASNRGVAYTRNRGIVAARGEYIALLDADDLWFPGKLEAQLSLISLGYDLVYCSYDFISGDGTPLTRKKPFIVPETTEYRKMLVSSVVSCSTVMLRSELMKAHPFRSNVYHEDYALWMELFSIPIRAAGDPSILASYRLQASSRSGAKLNAARKRWDIYRHTLRMDPFSSGIAFIRYAIRGVIKYI